MRLLSEVFESPSPIACFTEISMFLVILITSAVCSVRFDDGRFGSDGHGIGHVPESDLNAVFCLPCDRRDSGISKGGCERRGGGIKADWTVILEHVG